MNGETQSMIHDLCKSHCETALSMVEIENWEMAMEELKCAVALVKAQIAEEKDDLNATQKKQLTIEI